MSQPNDVDELIRTRRTINKFEPTPPPDDLILTALDAARWAPNHKLTDPWRFYLLGPETASQIIELNAELTRREKGDAAALTKRDKWSQIPGWLIVTYARSLDETRDRENYAAVCCAIQNLSLSLWDKGIGVKWTTGDVTRSSELYELLKINRSSEEIVGLLWYGSPAEEPTSIRRPLSEVLKHLP